MEDGMGIKFLESRTNSRMSLAVGPIYLPSKQQCQKNDKQNLRMKNYFVTCHILSTKTHKCKKKINPSSIHMITDSCIGN